MFDNSSTDLLSRSQCKVLKLCWPFKQYSLTYLLNNSLSYCGEIQSVFPKVSLLLTKVRLLRGFFKIICSPHCALSRVSLRFLYCFLHDVTKCEHSAATYIKKKIRSFWSNSIMDSKLYASFFSHDLIKQIFSCKSQ